MRLPNSTTGAATPREPAGSRDLSLDVAKGIGIVLVVLGHVLDGLIAARFFPPRAQWPSISVFVIYLFHMPLFFVVSGYLASLHQRPAGATVRKFIPTLVYPYFLWSILEGLTLASLSGATNSRTSISVIYGILWHPIVPYWFLYALFCCHLLYLMIRRRPRAVQIAFAVLLFLIPFGMQAMGLVPALIISETVKGFLFFLAGALSGSVIKEFGRWSAITASLLFAALAILLYQLQLRRVTNDAVLLVPAFMGIAATIAWARIMAGKNSWPMRTLAFWGRYSMSIYVMHIFVTAAVRIGLGRARLPAWYMQGGVKCAVAVTTEIALATLLGVLLPLAVNLMASRMNLDRWLGLQHMRRDREAAAGA